MKFAFVAKQPPVENGLRSRLPMEESVSGLSLRLSHQSTLRHLPLDGGERVLACGEHLKDTLHFGEVLGMRDCAACALVGPRIQAGLAETEATPDLFADASADIHREGRGRTDSPCEFDGYHEHVVKRASTSARRCGFPESPLVAAGR